MPGGRPTTYTPELASYICKIIATHKFGLRRLAAEYELFPHPSTIYAWMYDHPEFSEQYLNSRRIQATVLADSMLEIADEIPIYDDKDGVSRIDAGMLGRAKLEYEALKWHASKMAPKIYGEHKQVEELTSQNESIKKELEELRAKLAEQNKKEY